MGKLHDAVKAKVREALDKAGLPEIPVYGDAENRADYLAEPSRSPAGMIADLQKRIVSQTGLPGRVPFKVHAPVFVNDGASVRLGVVIECRGALGPNGCEIYRVSLDSRHGVTVEVREDQLLLVQGAVADAGSPVGYRVTPKADAPPKPADSPTESGSGQGAAKGAKGGPKKRKAPPRLPAGATYAAAWNGQEWRIELMCATAKGRFIETIEHRTLFGGLAKLDAIFRKWEKAAKLTVEQPEPKA